MGFLVKWDDSDFIKAGPCYQLDFDKLESALSGTVSLEPRPSVYCKSTVGAFDPLLKGA